MASEALAFEPFLPRDGYCPDPHFCIKMGGCMSGCTGGPNAEIRSAAPKVPEVPVFIAKEIAFVTSAQK